VAKYFGLPLEQVMRKMKINTNPDEVLSVEVTIAITADDLIKIGETMKIIEKEAQCG
jgi:hypothetical protein